MELIGWSNILNMIYISLGWNCSPAIIRKNKFKQEKKNGYLTQPFDLCVTPYSGLCECLKDDFACFFNLRIENGIIMNAYYMWFNHETEIHQKNNFAEFKKRYENRINNFKKYLTSGEEICFIHSNPFEDSTELCNILETNYPDLIFKILAIQNADIDVYKNHFSDRSDCKTHAEMGNAINFKSLDYTVDTNKIFYINNNNQLDKFKDFTILQNKYGKYYVPKGLNKGIDWVLSIGAVHEEETLQFIKNIIKPNSSIITAGTHIGTFLPVYSKIAKNVYGFEPDNSNYRYAISNIELNSLTNVTIENCALGDKTTIVHLQNKNLIENSLCRVIEEHNISNLEKSCKVVCKSLNNIFKDNNEEISIIQLDVEGYEEKVLNGAKNIIEKNRPIIIYESWGEKLKPIFKVLEHMGYILHENKINNNCIAYLPGYHNFSFVA